MTDCPHGYVIETDSCPGCDAIQDRTRDLALELVTAAAITATRAGATSDELEACVRRGQLIARSTLTQWPDPDTATPPTAQPSHTGRPSSPATALTATPSSASKATAPSHPAHPAPHGTSATTPTAPPSPAPNTDAATATKAQSEGTGCGPELIDCPDPWNHATDCQGE